MDDGTRKYSSYNGQFVVTNSGVPEPLSSTPQRVKRITIQAKEANAGVIKIGGSNMDNDNCLKLISLADRQYENTDLSFIYIDGTNGEGVNYEIEN